MALPFNLEKLPSEMLEVLRFLGTCSTPARVPDIVNGTRQSERYVLRAIRRLVNYNLIQIDDHSQYAISSEGKRAHAALLEADKAPKVEVKSEAVPGIPRRLTAVIPAALVFGQPTPIFIGIDPPQGEAVILDAVTLDLKIQVLGGTITPITASLNVPPNAAAAPARLSVTATVSDKPVRIKLDAYQAFQVAELKVAGRLFFDIPVVVAGSVTAGRRAVAVDLELSEET